MSLLNSKAHIADITISNPRDKAPLQEWIDAHPTFTVHFIVVTSPTTLMVIYEIPAE